MKKFFAFAVLLAVLSVSASAQTNPLPYYYSRSIGVYGSGTLLNIPNGVALDSSGNIYVGDNNGKRIAKFNSAGVFQPTSFPTTGFAVGVTLDSAGYVYVADRGANRIIKFTNGGYVAQYFGPAVSLTTNTPLNQPSAISLDSSGNLYVADSYNSRVVKFNPAGQSSQIFSVKGPHSVALDNAGNIYVTDDADNQVVEFNSSGGIVRTFGSYGTGNGQFNNPLGSVIDKAGNVYVADSGNGRVVEFTSAGIFLQNIGVTGSGDGQLAAPLSVAFDSNGNLYVTDGGNNRVLEFTQSVFTGTVTLEGLGTYTDTTGPDQNLTFTFQPQGSGTRFVRKQVLTPAGTFAFADIPAGTYDVAIKGACWLTRVVRGVTIGGNPVNINLTLIGSDLNNDNSVDSSDFGLLIGDYGNIGDSL